MTSRVNSINSLHDFIGYVVLCAPDAFPVRDYLPPDKQMNLAMAFEELRRGIELVKVDFPDADRGGRLSSVLDNSLALYLSGDDVRGARRLQDFEALIYKE